MKKIILYWRIFFLIALVCLFMANVIKQSTFIGVIIAIIIFHGIPWLYEKMKKQ